jgi:hypothetical protein
MAIRKISSFLISFVTVCSILGASLAVIAYGRGYRLDLKKSSIHPTGLVSVTSDPIGAQVAVDGKLKTATNNSFSVDPGWYTITISKEGYMSWQKKIRVQGEVVSRADAFLFPTNPSLTPLTTLGIAQPILSPDGSKIAYIIPVRHLDGSLVKKAGLWVYELAEGPLGRNHDPIQLGTIDSTYDITTATIGWSPDSTQILSDYVGAFRLYTVARPGTFTDVTSTAASILQEWNDEKITKEHQMMAAFKQPIIDIATTSAKIISFSPDETKILYEATASATIPQVINPALIGANSTTEERTIKPGLIYIYDSKEDKNYLVLDKTELPTPIVTPTTKTKKTTPALSSSTSWAQSIHWFPTSKHLLLTLTGKIDIMEYDRTNWVTIYSGPFEDSFVAPWSNGSRILILTNLNPNTSTLPNLYTVNLR